MPQYSFLSFAADNISNPNGAGGIPKEQQGNVLNWYFPLISFNQGPRTKTRRKVRIIFASGINGIAFSNDLKCGVIWWHITHPNHRVDVSPCFIIGGII